MPRRHLHLLGAAALGLAALTAPACAGNAASDTSPPPADAGVDAPEPADAAPELGDAPQGACQLTGDERSLGLVAAGSGNQALAWDGTRLAAVFQVQPSAFELRFAASDDRLTGLGAPATFTAPLVDCGAAVFPCHGAPSLAVDGPGAFAIVWSGFDPSLGAMSLYFGRLDAGGALGGFRTAVPGGADRPLATDLCALAGGYGAAWQQAHAARFAPLDAVGAGGAPEPLSAAAETAERPRLACAGATVAALYTVQTGADSRTVVFRARDAAGAWGAEAPLALGPLTRARAVALIADGDGFLAVLDAEGPAGAGQGAAWVARLDGAGAVTDGPRVAVAAAADETLTVEAAVRTPPGDVAIVGTRSPPDGAHAFFQRVNRYGQALHPPVDLSDGYPSLAGQPMGALAAALPDRTAVSFVAAPVAGAGTMILRTVSCDF
jgi:hypothetical protein